MKDHLQRWIRAERLVISVSGSIPTQKVEKWISDLENTLKQEERLKRDVSGQSQDPVQPPFLSPRWVERSLGREQLHILVGGRGLTMTSPQRSVLYLLHG